MPLTPQRELFAQAVAAGKSQAEAYREAYPRSRGWKPASVWQKASALMADGNVSARVDEIRAELAKRSLWTREKSVEILSEIATDTEASRKDRTQAVRVLNDMHGYNAPTRVEHSGGVTITAGPLDEDI